MNKLAPLEITAILDHISAVEPQPVILRGEQEIFSGGTRRSTIKLATNHKAYVVSISPSDHGDWQEKRKFHQYLYKNGAPVVRPVGDVGRLPNGEMFEVNEFIEGKSLPSFKIITPESLSSTTIMEIERFGAGLARIHALSESYFRDNAIEPDHNAVSWQSAAKLLRKANETENYAVEHWLRHGKNPQLTLRSVRESKELAYDLSGGTFTASAVHGDAHIANAVITSKGEPVFIDLTEFCGQGIAMQDVAFAMLSACVAREKSPSGLKITIDQEKINAFLRGYEREKKLLEGEKETLFTFIKIQAKILAFRAYQRGGEPEYVRKWEQVIGSWADGVIASERGVSQTL